MFDSNKVTEIFYLVDEFCKEFDKNLEPSLLGNPPKRKPKMILSEVITISILFHKSNFRMFKHFYNKYVKIHMKSDFPQTVSYNRFVELQQASLLHLAMFVKMCLMGENTGISFIDSTPIRVCSNKRISRNKVFSEFADTGKSTMGWFYGFKLHIVINDQGEIINFMITKASVDDRTPLKKGNFLKDIFGKLYADKGYIGQKLFESLFDKGIHIVTGIRTNMKNRLISMHDKIMLRKRSIIETINDQLKNISQVEHTRHRSVTNFAGNLIAGIAAYCLQPKKPSISTFQFSDSKQLTLF